MATCLQVPIMVPSSLRSSSSSSSISTTTSCSSFDMNPKIGWRNYVSSKRLNYNICSASKIPLPPVDPNDPFIRRLAAHIQDNPKPSPNSDFPPFMDLFTQPTMSSSVGGAHGVQGARVTDYGPQAPRRGLKFGFGRHVTSMPPPDLPSVLLDERIIFLGMPMVPAVTELIVAQFVYLQYVDDTAPIYLYINSTGTTRDDNQVVGHDGEGFAILNAMDGVRNDVETVCLGTAGGHACLLLAGGKLGKRSMLPHCRIVMRAPPVPATGLLQASDVFIQAKEAAMNRDMLFKLFALFTGHRYDDVKEKLKHPFYMGAKEALEYGVVDKILFRGQEELMPDLLTPEYWDKLSRGKSVLDPENN